MAVNNIQLNARKPLPTVGLDVYLPNVPRQHNCIVADSITSENPLKIGDFIALDTTSTNPYAPVVRKATVTDQLFGIIPHDIRRSVYFAHERVAKAETGDTLWLPAAEAFAAGTQLQFNADYQVTSTITSGNSYVGTAETPSTAENDLVQVKLNFYIQGAAAGGESAQVGSAVVDESKVG